MTDRLIILLSPYLMERMADNNQPYYQKITEAFEFIGFQVDALVDSEANIAMAARSDAYVLSHLHHPIKPGALTARPTITYPFWTLEASANPIEKFAYSNKFLARETRREDAAGFFGAFANRVLGEDDPADEQDFVLLAFQGRLSKQRYWQSMSPLEMLASLKAAETKRRILIKLHPNEVYSSDERAAVDALCDERVVISEKSTESLLKSCDYTVSMNSTVSLKGLFARKPGLLFGDADFHHPFAKVNGASDIPSAIETALNTPIAYRKYLHWYFKSQMINVLSDSFHHDVLMRCKKLGWNISVPPQEDLNNAFA